VDSLVRDIRIEQSGLKKDLVKVGPWEGYEGMLDEYNLSGWLSRYAYLDMNYYSLREIWDSRLCHSYPHAFQEW
jgi:hypothetical protein